MNKLALKMKKRWERSEYDISGLLSMQKKFGSYKYNIFILNKVIFNKTQNALKIQHWLYCCWSKEYSKLKSTNPIEAKLLDDNGCPVKLSKSNEKSNYINVGTFGSECRFPDQILKWKYYTQSDKQKADDNVSILAKAYLRYTGNPKSMRFIYKGVHKQKNRTNFTHKDDIKKQKRPIMTSREIDEMYKEYKKNFIKPISDFKTNERRNLELFETPKKIVYMTPEKKINMTRSKSTNKSTNIKQQKSNVGPFSFYEKEKSIKSSYHKEPQNAKKSLTEKDLLINNLSAKKYLSRLYVEIMYKCERIKSINKKPKFNHHMKMTVSELYRMRDQAAKIIQRRFKKFHKRTIKSF